METNSWRNSQQKSCSNFILSYRYHTASVLMGLAPRRVLSMKQRSIITNRYVAFTSWVLFVTDPWLSAATLGDTILFPRWSTTTSPSRGLERRCSCTGFWAALGSDWKWGYLIYVLDLHTPLLGKHRYSPQISLPLCLQTCSLSDFHGPLKNIAIGRYTRCSRQLVLFNGFLKVLPSLMDASDSCPWHQGQISYILYVSTFVKA